MPKNNITDIFKTCIARGFGEKTANAIVHYKLLPRIFYGYQSTGTHIVSTIKHNNKLYVIWKYLRNYSVYILNKSTDANFEFVILEEYKFEEFRRMISDIKNGKCGKL